MSVVKYKWMLQNASVTAFTVSKLLREKQQEGRVKLPPTPPPRLGLAVHFGTNNWNEIQIEEDI